MQGGLTTLFRACALRRLLQTPEEYATVIYGFCMVPRRIRFEPHKILTFCLVRNAEPVFDFKFELAGDEVAGIKAETSGMFFPGHHYSVGSLSRQTMVGTVIPEVLSMLLHRRHLEMPDEAVVDLIFDQLLDVSRCYLSPD